MLPTLNKDVCGGESAPCDELCGGPGACGHCGGPSCLAGSVRKAEKAKSFADEADEKLNEKQKEAEEVRIFWLSDLIKGCLANTRVLC